MEGDEEQEEEEIAIRGKHVSERLLAKHLGTRILVIR